MSEGVLTKIGHGLAIVLGIDLKPNSYPAEDRVNSTYIESDPTTREWIVSHMPTRQQARQYVYNLFPFLHWIRFYNLQWLIGDLVAGITVGAVVIPQGMAYAELAKLPPEYGLYSSFMGVLIYWFFATSKDITIGPVAVMSTLVGTIIVRTQASHPGIEAPVIASALAIICGAIITVFGFLRLGFIVDFIPLPAITAFMTGSAINVCAGQVQTVLGETAKFSTSGATYQIIIDTLRYLPTSQIDAAMGLTALAMLYAIRSACNYRARKKPHQAKLFFFLSTLRTAFVVLFYTMISAAVNLHRRHHPAFKLLGNVPRGFKHAYVPKINAEIINSFSGELQVAVIVLLIEHIAISKSFGRVNNYTIDPSQEFIAIGISNLLGPFLGAYPATGSFSRTAIKAKCGVRTPLAGVITAIVVLLAIYALPPLFYYIPKSSLSAVIIHAVGDLVTPPNTAYQFWRISPIDALIFLMGVIVIVFSTIEIGIYCTICLSLAVLLFRLAKARGQFLGQVKVHSVIGDHLLDDGVNYAGRQAERARDVYLTTSRADGFNPRTRILQPGPGVFIYRLSDGLNYPNANHYTDDLVQHIFDTTRRTDLASDAAPGDRPWNDPAPGGQRGYTEEDVLSRPTLRAIVLDCASVNNVDVTCVQTLIDVRNQLDRYAAPDRVQWHFAHVHNRWTRRALAAAGFGFPARDTEGSRRWRAIFSVADMDGGPSMFDKDCSEVVGRDVETGVEKQELTRTTERSVGGEKPGDLEDDIGFVQAIDERPHRRRNAPSGAIVEGVNRPFFHVDLTSALQSALSNSHSSAVSLS